MARNGTIIKGHRRVPSNLRPASGYTMKDRSAPAGADGRWVFVVNGTKLKLWEAVAPRLLKQLSTVDVKVYATKYPGHGRRLAERAARSGADLVGAIGGDGTLNEVVDGVMRAGVLGPDGLPKATVTVLPLGTASDFHRSMAWDPSDFEEAMWRIGKRGSTAVLDVARVRCASPDGPRERHFVNIASAGASAAAAFKLDRWRWLGQTGSYRIAALGALFSHTPRALAVRLDGGEWTQAAGTTLLAVGNGAYFGNGLNICPDANPYDGVLQVVIARRVGALDFLFKRRKLKMGRHLEEKAFSAAQGRRVDVALWDPRTKGPAEDGAWEVFEADPPPPSPVPVMPPGLGDTSRSASFSDAEAAAAAGPGGVGAPVAREWSGSDRSGRSGSTSMSGPHASPSMRRSMSSIAAESAPRRAPPKRQLSDYGPMPLEVDGEVIGHAPFSITVIPGAIKFRV